MPDWPERAIYYGCFRTANGFKPPRTGLGSAPAWGPWHALAMTTARLELLDELVLSVYHSTGDLQRLSRQVVHDAVSAWGGEAAVATQVRVRTLALC